MVLPSSAYTPGIFSTEDLSKTRADTLYPPKAATEAAIAVTERLAHNVYDPDAYGAVRDDSGSGTASTNLAALQEAADDALADGGVFRPVGTYYIDGELHVQSDIDARFCTLIQLDDSTAQSTLVYGSRVNSDEVFNRVAFLPHVEQAGKVGTGWSGNDTGIELANLYHGQVFVPHVQNFSRNLLLTAYGTGAVHNNIYLGWLENGKVNLELVSDATGWVNQNQFYGGRCHHNGGEGAGTSGARHLKLTQVGTREPNSNIFIGTSLEGDVSEYHVECFGPYNQFVNCRWESTTPKAYFNGTAAVHNVITGGYQAQNVDVLEANGANSNKKIDALRTFWRSSGGTAGVLVLENSSSSASAALTVLGALAGHEADPATAYGASIAANVSRFKTPSDANPRVQINHTSGSIAFGNSVSAPTLTIGNFGSVGLQTNGYFRVGTVASLPTASSAYRGMFIRVEGGTGVADTTYQCLKTDADTYAWVEVATG